MRECSRAPAACVDGEGIDLVGLRPFRDLHALRYAANSARPL